MNPHQKISLDPKLKEAYDSVMNIKTPQAAPPPITQAPVISQSSWPRSRPQIISQPPISFPQPSFQPHPLITPTIVAYNSPTQNKQAEGKWGWRWILVVFAIAVFLLGYSIFWIKVFGIKLPFLSSFL
ncbi:MAG: hypothetical protein AAB583_02700 [Patescibacteria group bacterium]